MNDPIYTAFLDSQRVQGLGLARQSDLLEVIPVPGQPSNRFLLNFRCQGLIQDRQGRIVTYDHWTIGVRFPEHYLRVARPHPAEVLSYLGPCPTPWHPNIQCGGPFICMEIKPSMTLVQIIYGLYDLITYHLYATDDDGLNKDASQWVRHQEPGRFPIDPRPLKRRSESPSTPAEIMP
jgi:hypothetical protein